MNALGVSAYVSSFYDITYTVSVLTISVGEFIAAVGVGYPLMIAIERMLLRLERTGEPEE